MSTEKEIHEQIILPLKQLEEISNSKYEAKLIPLNNTDQTTILNDFKKRGPYRVHSLPKHLRELEGTYQTYQEIEQKIHDLGLPYYASEVTNNQIKCAKCSAWRDRHPDLACQHKINKNTTCMFSEAKTDSPWKDISISLPHIVKKKTGRMGAFANIVEPLGRVNFN